MTSWQESLTVLRIVLAGLGAAVALLNLLDAREDRHAVEGSSLGELGRVLAEAQVRRETLNTLAQTALVLGAVVPVAVPMPERAVHAVCELTFVVVAALVLIKSLFNHDVRDRIRSWNVDAR